MPSQIDIGLNVTANVSQARNAFAQIQKDLKNIQQNKIEGDFGLDEKTTKATMAVQNLRDALKDCFNVNTGKIDLNKFQEQLKLSGMSLKDYQSVLSNLGVEGQQTFNKIATAIATTDTSLQKSHSVLSNFLKTFKQTVTFQATTSVYRSLVSGIQSAYRYAQDLNESLNNIRIVTGKSSEEMARFAQRANEAAKNLSTKTTTYTDASLIYYQQGLDDKQVKERTDATIKMANVSGQSATTVSDQMTAIWNNFDNGSKSLEYYADVITALGAATASSSSEISQGLEKFAAVADTIGLSYEYATAALATVTAETRQSADVVGTAFKTLFARLQQLKQEGSVMDEDGMTVSLGQYSSALQNIGVNILDQYGQVKDMNAILDEMGEKWSSLTKEQQIATAQSVAGVRQYTQLVALMDDWSQFKVNLNVAQTSEGTLTQQAKIYSESWEAARTRVTASLEAVYDKLLDDNFFIDLTNNLSKTIDFISTLFDKMGGIQGLLLPLGALLVSTFDPSAVMIGLNNTVDKLAVGLQGLGAPIKTSQDAFRQMAAEALKASKATTEVGSTAMAQTVFDSKMAELIDTQWKASLRVSDAQKKINAAKVAEVSQLQTKLSDIIGTTKTQEKELDQVIKNIAANSADKGKTGQILQEGKTEAQKAVNKDALAGWLNTYTKDFSTSMNRMGSVDVFGKQEISQAQELVQKLRLQINDTRDGLDQLYNTQNGEAFTDMLGGNQNAFNQIKAALDEVTKAEEKMNKAPNHSKEKRAATEKYREALKALNAAIKENGIQERSQAEIRDDVRQALLRANNATNENIASKQKEIDLLEEEKKELEVDSDQYKKLTAEIKEQTKELEKLRNIHNNIESLDGDQIDEMAKKMRSTGTATIDAATRTGFFSRAIDELKQKMLSFSLQDLVSGIQSVASTVMMAVSAWQAWQRALETFDNEEATAQEKLAALTQAVLTTTGALGPAIGSISKIGGALGLAREKSKDAAGAIQSSAQKTGTVVAAAGAKATAAWAAFIAIILVVVALAATFYFAWYKPMHLLDEQVKEANKNLEDATKKVEELTNAFDELNESVNKIEDLQDKLKDMAQGTEEWKKTVAELNDEILNLVNNNEGLAELVTYDVEAGHLTLDTSSDDYQNYLKRQEEELRQSKIDKNNAQLVKESTDLQKAALDLANKNGLWDSLTYEDVSKLVDEAKNGNAEEIKKALVRWETDDKSKQYLYDLGLDDKDIKLLGQNSEELIKLLNTANDLEYKSNILRQQNIDLALQGNDKYDEADSVTQHRYANAVSISQDNIIGNAFDELVNNNMSAVDIHTAAGMDRLPSNWVNKGSGSVEVSASALQAAGFYNAEALAAGFQNWVSAWHGNDFDSIGAASDEQVEEWMKTYLTQFVDVYTAGNYLKIDDSRIDDKATNIMTDVDTLFAGISNEQGENVAKALFDMIDNDNAFMNTTSQEQKELGEYLEELTDATAKLFGFESKDEMMLRYSRLTGYLKNPDHPERGWTQAGNNYGQEYAKRREATNYISDLGGKGSNNWTRGTLLDITDNFQQAFSAGAVSQLNDMLKGVNDETAKWIAKNMDAVDWSSQESIEDFERRMNEAGIEIDSTNEEWNNFKNQMIAASNGLKNFSTLLSDTYSKYDALNSITSKKQGDTLTQKEYDEFIAAFPELKNNTDYFVQKGNNWVLQKSGEEFYKDYQQKLEADAISNIQEYFKVSKAVQRAMMANRPEEAGSQPGLENNILPISFSFEELQNEYKDWVDRSRINKEEDVYENWIGAFASNNNLIDLVANSIENLSAETANKAVEYFSEGGDGFKLNLDEMETWSADAQNYYRIIQSMINQGISLLSGDMTYVNELGQTLIAQSNSAEEVWGKYVSWKEKGLFTDEDDEWIASLALGMVDASEQAEIWAYAQELLTSKYVETQTEAIALAAAHKRLSDGYASLKDNIEDYVAILNSATEGSFEYTEAMTHLKMDLAKMFDIDWKDIPDLKSDVVNGIYDAIASGDAERIFNEAQKAIATSSVAGNRDKNADVYFGKNLEKYNEYLENTEEVALKLQGAFDSLNFSELKEGMNLGEAFGEDQIKIMNEALKNGTSTIDQLQSELAELGFELELPEMKMEKAEVQAGEQYPVYDKATGEFLGMEWATKAQEYYFPVIQNTDGTWTGGVKNDTTKTPKGGGGSKKKKNTDEVNRYIKVKNELENIKSQYEALGKARERAFGTKHLELMEQENAVLDKQIQKEKEYQDEIENYLNLDRLKAEEIGAIIDENGVIINEEDLRKSWVEQYNKGKIDDDRYSELEKILDKYNETWDLGRDHAEEILELQRKYWDNELEQISKSLELQNNLSDKYIKHYQNLLSEIEKDAYNAAESIALISKEMDANLAKAAQYEQSIRDTLLLNTSLTEDEANSLAQAIAGGDINAIQSAWDALGENVDRSKIMEQITSYSEQLYSIKKELDELADQTFTKIADTVNDIVEDFDDLTKKVDHLNTVSEHYKNILDLTGQTGSKVAEEVMDAFNDINFNNGLNKMLISRDKNNELQRNLQQLKDEYHSMMDSLSEDDKKRFEDQIKNLEEAAKASELQFLSDYEALLQGLVDKFSESLEKAGNNFGNAIAKLAGQNSLDILKAEIERADKAGEKYLDDYEKAYELSKLAADISNSINDVDSLKGKKALADILDRINAAREDGNEMSEYELEMLQNEYDLEMARIALEDARDAKKMVRLVRDQEGNYNYVYTADQDRVDKLQDEYDKLLKERTEKTEEYIKEQRDNILGLEEEVAAAIDTIANDTTISFEEKQKKIANLYEEYSGYITNISDQIALALGVNADNQNLQDKRYGEGLIDLTKTLADMGLVDENGSLNIIDYTDNMLNNLSQYIDTATESAQKIADLNQIVNENAGLIDASTNESITSSAEELQKNLIDKNQIVSDSLEELKNNLENVFDETINSVEDFVNKYEEQMIRINNLSKNATEGILGLQSNEINYQNPAIVTGVSLADAASMDTGGYTGKWGSEGKIAILHQNEVVASSDQVDGLIDLIDKLVSAQAYSASRGLGALSSATLQGFDFGSGQVVTINAEFPGVTDHNEIELAFENIKLRASQYAGSY